MIQAQVRAQLVHKVWILSDLYELNNLWHFIATQVVTDEGENIYFYQQELKVSGCKISRDNSGHN